jgi:Domain of unknown function (DUF4276)
MEHGTVGRTSDNRRMKIALLVEGKTEVAFLPKLREFLERRLSGRMPKIDPLPYDGRIPTGDKLRRVVANLLDGRDPAEAVVALTDVYTGSNDFRDAAEAKNKMRNWVGNDGRFHPHVALHDFEAWLLPYWPKIARLSGSNRRAPTSPENVNHQKPPARLLADIFRAKGKSYMKTLHAVRILRDEDLTVAANACRELRALLNTILTVSGGAPI